MLKSISVIVMSFAASARRGLRWMRHTGMWDNR